MATIRRERRNTPFVQIDKECLQDKTLSWKAKGLLAYLLSLPDDWQIYLSELSNHATDGKDSTQSAMNQLIQAGYITKQKAIRKAGQFTGYNYTVAEKPSRLNRSGKTVDGKTVYGKTATTNNNSTNNNSTNNNRERSAREIESIPCCLDQAIDLVNDSIGKEKDSAQKENDWAALAEQASAIAQEDLPDFAIVESETPVINLNPTAKDRQEVGELMAGYYETETGINELEVMCYAAGVPLEAAQKFMPKLCVKWALKQTAFKLHNWRGETGNLSTWIQNENKSHKRASDQPSRDAIQRNIDSGVYSGPIVSHQ